MRKAPIRRRRVDTAWQRAEYNLNMDVKRGKLVWDELANHDRFGARGGFVTPDEYAARRANPYPVDNPETRLAKLQAEYDQLGPGYTLLHKELADRIHELRNGVPVAA